jgi:hypothetical protein
MNLNPPMRAEVDDEETPENLAAFEDDSETVDADDMFLETGDDDEEYDEEPLDQEETPSLGVDEALEDLRDSNPAAYNALKGLQAGATKWNQFSDRVDNVNQMQRELHETLEALAEEEVPEEVGALPVGYRTSRGTNIPEYPEGHPLHGISEEQWELTLAMMDELGYKPESEVEAKAATRAVAEAQGTYIGESSQAGVQAFGEDYGQVVDGKLVLTEEAQAAIQPIHERLYDPKQGITSEDLYILKLFETGELITKDQASEIADEEDEVQQQRVAKRRRATVVQRAPAGRRREVIYDPRKGDTLTDAIKAATRLSARQHGVPRR